MNMSQQAYSQAEALARKAFQLSLEKEVYHSQELLQRARNALKRLSGDLPIVGYDSIVEDSSDTPFVTQSIEEARAWGWLEMASGVFKLVQDRPGASMVHFKRAWRIWRPWSMAVEKTQAAEVQQEATRERVRAGLWLGEAWARFMSERAQSSARAVLRAALAELARIESSNLLEETIAQQRMLPPALLGSPAHQPDGLSAPYVCTLIQTEPHLSL